MPRKTFLICTCCEERAVGETNLLPVCLVGESEYSKSLTIPTCESCAAIYSSLENDIYLLLEAIKEAPDSLLCNDAGNSIYQHEAIRRKFGDDAERVLGTASSETSSKGFDVDINRAFTMVASGLFLHRYRRMINTKFLRPVRLFGTQSATGYPQALGLIYALRHYKPGYRNPETPQKVWSVINPDLFEYAFVLPRENHLRVICVMRIRRNLWAVTIMPNPENPVAMRRRKYWKRGSYNAT